MCASFPKCSRGSHGSSRLRNGRESRAPDFTSISAMRSPLATPCHRRAPFQPAHRPLYTYRQQITRTPHHDRTRITISTHARDETHDTDERRHIIMDLRRLSMARRPSAGLGSSVPFEPGKEAGGAGTSKGKAVAPSRLPREEAVHNNSSRLPRVDCTHATARPHGACGSSLPVSRSCERASRVIGVSHAPGLCTQRPPAAAPCRSAVWTSPGSSRY